ncbi:MAG: cobalamin-independent methionine synthase II family protein [Candidatus Rokubacteria bacterium]|nr:cobalamin-independent methionine synthase II family protein [Candidatus Rokubacteria bacterium]
MGHELPLLPTTVVGSHALPSWLFLVREAQQAERLGPTDLQEAYDDAVRLAVRDQIEAGVDVISDGEMRRTTFIRGFYERLTGLQPLPIPRRLGPPNYDSHCPFEIVGRVEAPRGLGIVDEFRFARAHADRPMRVAVPGPMTLLMPLRRGGPYASEDTLVADLIAIVRAEVRGLVEAGCELIQIDEPNYVMTAGKHRVLRAGPGPMLEALRAVVGDTRVKLALHICFGNAHNNSFAAPRHYRPLYPQILEAPVAQLVLEYANREMAEIDLWSLFPTDKEVAVGVVDVKAFRVESAEDVAARARLALKHLPAEQVWLVPDCGLWETPRWVAISKLRSMVEAARLLRRELSGKS